MMTSAFDLLSEQLIYSEKYVWSEFSFIFFLLPDTESTEAPNIKSSSVIAKSKET